MKYSFGYILKFMRVAALIITIASFAFLESADEIWNSYHVGKIEYINNVPDRPGGKVYDKLVGDPEVYFGRYARMVLKTLYLSPKDTIKEVSLLRFTLNGCNGIAAKSNAGSEVYIELCDQWIGKIYDGSGGDMKKVDSEMGGVLVHELTHAYQLEPQGIGDYGSSPVFWAFIEGMADAVRYVNGYFTEEDYMPDKEGKKYLTGYRTTGFFLGWLAKTKDKDFLRKFNRSTLYVIPWSFDGGVKYALGRIYDVDVLWDEFIAFRQKK